LTSKEHPASNVYSDTKGDLKINMTTARKSKQIIIII